MRSGTSLVQRGGRFLEGFWYEVTWPRRLRAHAPWLRPGRWVPVDSSRRVWRHVEAELPNAVAAPGGKGNSSKGRSRVAEMRIRPTPASLSQSLNRLRRRQVMVPVSEARRSDAVAVIRVQGSRAHLVALSPHERQAIRVGGRGAYDAAYVDARRRFQRWVAAPAFSVSDDGAVLVEQWCEGVLVSQLPGEQQAAYATKLLEDLAALTAAETTADEESWWRRLPAALERVTLPAPLRASLEHPAVQQALSTSLLVPSQGDLHPGNLVVDSGDGQPRVVDFDYAGWVPIWFDTCKLVSRIWRHSEAGRDTIAVQLWQGLENVLQAAGVPEARGMGLSQIRALVAVGWDWWKVVSDRGAPPADEELEERIRRAWVKESGKPG